jgi:hypothetical protein
VTKRRLPMEYMLKLSSPSGTITLNYGDNQASRGATVGD